MRTWNPLLLLLPVLVFPLSGCGSAQVTMASGTNLAPPRPVPNTPVAVVRLVEWAWNKRDTTAIRDAFTGDFLFHFAVLDTFGNRYRDTPWTYTDELVMSRRVFVGGSPTEPPATRCEVTFDPMLVVGDDPRPGKDPGWHKMISTNVDLRVRTDESEHRIIGRARFFAVRGDSAVQPPRDTGQFPMDESRWLIERWEDETLPDPGLQPALPPGKTQAATGSSWGSIKAMYRNDSLIPLVP